MRTNNLTIPVKNYRIILGCTGTMETNENKAPGLCRAKLPISGIRYIQRLDMGAFFYF